MSAEDKSTLDVITNIKSYKSSSVIETRRLFVTWFPLEYCSQSSAPVNLELTRLGMADRQDHLG